MSQRSTLIMAAVLLVVASVLQCTAYLQHEMNLPLPAFSMNITQDENVGVEKRVFRRLGVSQENEDGSTAPLFEGLGTHYSFIWVGTPPQRVSVIMDTGSHHTAFPCTGCKCGKHMDPHFDPKRSSSNTIKSCGGDNKKCYFKQSYTEGSSWSAFKVRDKVWVGGPGASDVENADRKSIDFDFGCQESETGLFRSQKVDGIMGLSAAADTLPFQLHAAGVTKTKMFGLCFRHGGGVVTLGGVDTSLHVPSVQSQYNRTGNGGVYFAALTKAKGWYTVKMVDVLMRPQHAQATQSNPDNAASPNMKSVGGDVSKYNGGKGTIVDSGTTDTYLPSALKAQFQTLFRTYAGREFSNKQAQYSKDQFAKLPVIVFRMLAAGGGGVLDLEVFPSSYMELHRDGPNVPVTPNQAGRYTPRIYLTEGSGAVIGANSINEHNVIFDPDNMRVGFARSTCTYEKSHSRHDFATSTNGPPHPQLPPVQEQATTPPAKSSKVPSSAAKTDPLASAAKPGASASKGKSTINVKNPAKNSAPGVKPAPGSSKTASKAVSKLDLSATQKKAFMTVIRRAVDAFMLARHAPCKPVLAMPCNARCDRMPFSDPMVPDMGIISHSDSELEYLHVNSRGEVSVASAVLVQGQQFWKVPSCDAESPALSPSSARMLRNDTTLTTGAATTSLRGPADVSSAFAYSHSYISRALSARQASDVKSDKVDPIDKLLQEEEAAELQRQQSQHRISPESCSVYCPAPSGATAADSDRPMPMRLKGNRDETWSACDQAGHVRKQLQTTSGLVDVADQNAVLVLRGAADGTTAAESCFEVKNAKQLWRSAHAAAPTEEDGGLTAAVPSKCMVAQVVEEPCVPYFFNCTSPVSAIGTSASIAADEAVVTVHLKLTGLAYSALAAHQEADLAVAFANIFKISPGSVSIVVSPPAAGFTFSLRSSISVQVYMKVKPVSGGLLPADLLKVVSRISNSKVVSAKIGQQAAHKQLVNSSLKNYILAILEHPNFSTVLAGAVLEADSSPKRSGWLVSSGISVVGVTTMVGAPASPGAEVLSGSNSGVAVSSAYREAMDLLNAEVCTAVYSSWSGYFGLGKNDPLSNNKLPSYQRGAWMLYAFATGLLFLTLIGAAVYLLRRHIARDKQAQRRNSDSQSSHGGGGPSSGNSGNSNSTNSSGQQSAPASSSDAAAAPMIAVATGSSAAQSKTAGNTLWDKRRKVLQKFTVKR